MNRYYDCIIIGGGAAGLFAAITAAMNMPGNRIAVIEKEGRVAKKLLTTGNGRCNLSNNTGLQGRYKGDTEIAMQAFNAFGVEQTCHVMRTLGIDVVALENGKLFPRSLQAGSVVDQLRMAAEERKISLLTNCAVYALSAGKQFVLETSEGNLQAKKVLVATGGKAGIAENSIPTGYDMLQQLGHTCVPLTPAIVQIITEKERIKPLTGIKVEGYVIAKAGGEQREAFGEILFAEYGVSGPPILQVSELIGRHGAGELLLDLMPTLTADEIEREIQERCHRFGTRPCSELLLGFMNKRLGQTVIKVAGIPKLSVSCGEISASFCKAIAATIKEFRLKAIGTKGWRSAQVTAGGIKADEFHGNTMESRLVPGLYAAGEVLNVTGDCGGFNLQWAWTSGYLAGKNMAQESKE